MSILFRPFSAIRCSWDAAVEHFISTESVVSPPAMSGDNGGQGKAERFVLAWGCVPEEELHYG